RRQHFNRDFASERIVVGAVDLAHASDAEQASNRVGAEALAHPRTGGVMQNARSGDDRRRYAHESSGLCLLCEQRLDFTKQRRIVLTRDRKKGGALIERARQRLVAEVFDLAPPFRCHRARRLPFPAAATASPSSSRA